MMILVRRRSDGKIMEARPSGIQRGFWTLSNEPGYYEIYLPTEMLIEDYDFLNTTTRE